MDTIRVAAVSMDGRLGDPQGVLAEVADWTAKAKAAGAELILFPEVLIHGHCTPNTWELAESVPEGPSTQALCDLAKKHDLFLCVGLSEKERDIVYNTQVVVGPQGYIGKQRKLHMSRDEALFYKGGREMPVFDLGKCRVGIVICYDNTFPEVARVLALKGAEVILMPHAARLKMWNDSPESERQARQFAAWHYRTTTPCRCKENACFAVVADQAGRSGIVSMYPPDSPAQPHHPGGAYIFNPQGEVVANAQEERVAPEMIVADLQAENLQKARRDPNFTLRTRRPELFQELLREQVSW